MILQLYRNILSDSEQPEVQHEMIINSHPQEIILSLIHLNNRVDKERRQDRKFDVDTYENTIIIQWAITNRGALRDVKKLIHSIYSSQRDI